MRQVLGGDHPEAAGLVIGERLFQPLPSVHHERPVQGDRLIDRPPAEQQNLQPGGVPRVLAFIRADRQGITGTEQRQLTFE